MIWRMAELVDERILTVGMGLMFGLMVFVVVVWVFEVVVVVVVGVFEVVVVVVVGNLEVVVVVVVGVFEIGRASCRERV